MIEEPNILDRHGAAAGREGETFLLEEAQEWWIHLPGSRAEAVVESQTLHWDSHRGAFRLELPFAVGRMELLLSRGDHRRAVPLRVRPAGHKMDERTWATLLDDLHRWLPAVLGGLEGPRQGSVHTDGAEAPLLAEALLPLVPALEAALRQVLESPRLRTEDIRHDSPLHRTRAADRETVAWIARHPREAAWLNPARQSALTGTPPVLPVPSTRETLDHPVNRHVAWLVAGVIARLRGAAAALGSDSRNELRDRGAWSRARALACARAADGLDRQWRASPLRGLRAEPASESALLVVLDHPAYSQMHRLARRFLQARLQLAEGELAAATRPSFQLYELWCLLALQRLLADALGPGWDSRWFGMSKLGAQSGSGADVRWKASREQEQITLHFNPTFERLRSLDRVHKRHSLSKERRPDFVLTRVSKAGRSWVALDAKYRVGVEALGDAMTSVHLYRDALRWPEFGGAAKGGFLVAPRKTADAALWFDPAFHTEHRMGVLALCPGSPVPAATTDALRALLREP